MIPILMDSSKSLTALAADQTNGLGTLSECTSCDAKEERNGAFTLELKLPQGAKHFSDVTVGGVIKAKARDTGDPQLFRISKITKPMQGVVTIYANHISYDLNKTSVLPFSSTGIVSTLQTMKTKMQGGNAFTLSTDIVNTSSTFSNKVPQSARALFGGQQGSLLDVFGGEYLFDNLQVSLLGNRGNDNGVTLRYGKNITDLSQEENIENTYTAIQPYVVDSNENAVLGDLLTVIQSAEPKIMNLDLSNKFSGNDTPTVAQINAAAQQYAEANNIGVPKVSIKVSFVALWQTEEYKDIAPLERVSLCDTVTVVFEKLGVNAKAKVISTTYDTLRERYTEIEIGDARSTLASTISGISQDNKNAVASASGFLDNTIQQFTSLIANGLGLFVTREAVGETGGYKYYLHNRPTLAESQYQWTFNSNGFAVSQDYGATWSAGIDADGNAVFNSIAANIINAMEIHGSYIEGGQITSPVIIFNVKTTPVEIVDGYYSVYDYASASTVRVEAARVRAVSEDDRWAGGFAVSGGFAFDSKNYPAFLQTSNNHTLSIQFGTGDRLINNRYGGSTPGLYIINYTAGSQSDWIVLKDAGGITISSKSGINLQTPDNPTGVLINNYAPVQCSPGHRVTCQAGTSEGNNVLNFFYDGTYYGHTVH